MLKKNHITKLIIGFGVIFFSRAAISQVWNPSHKVGVVTGKNHFSYSQTPDQLVEMFPAAVPNTGLTYQWEQSTQPTTGDRCTTTFNKKLDQKK